MILLLFHLVTLVYLYKTLQILNCGRFNLWLLFFYTTNIYLIYPLMLWGSGLHRFPYIFFSISCLYYYLRYRFVFSKKYLLIAFVSFILALGFYSKALLIPVYLLSLELCLINRTEKTKIFHNVKIISIFMSISLCYIIWYVFWSPMQAQAFSLGYNINITWMQLNGHHPYACMAAWFTHQIHIIWNIIKIDIMIFLQSPFAVFYNPDALVCNFIILTIWLSILFYTVIKTHYAILIWFTGALAIGLNFLMIAISNRSIYGANSPRFYFEVMFLLIIFFNIMRGNLSQLNLKFFRSIPQYIFLLAAVGYMILSFCTGVSSVVKNHPNH